MSLIRLSSSMSIRRPVSLCLGTFDGVHLGHQALISACVGKAGPMGLVPSAFVFERPPALVFSKNKAEPVLTEIREKGRLLERYGIEQVVYTAFDEQFSNCSYLDFFDRIIVREMNAKHVVVGFHYRFGKHAEGNAAILTDLCKASGISIDVIPPVRTADGLLVSSTAVRRFIIEGNRGAAEAMLGRSLLPREEQLLGGVANE